MGHFAAVCKTEGDSNAASGCHAKPRSSTACGRNAKSQYVQYVEEDDDEDEVLGVYTTWKPKKTGQAPIQVSMLLDKVNCQMQLDRGATVSVMANSLHEKPSHASQQYQTQGLWWSQNPSEWRGAHASGVEAAGNGVAFDCGGW